jgi:hypothetical protein
LGFAHPLLRSGLESFKSLPEFLALSVAEAGALPRQHRALPRFSFGLAHELAGLVAELFAFGGGEAFSRVPRPFLGFELGPSHELAGLVAELFPFGLSQP